MKGLPSAETAAYSDICGDFEQRMGNPQWKGFPPFAVIVELIRASLDLCWASWLTPGIWECSF